MLKLRMVPASQIQATSALKRTIVIGASFCVAVFVITNPHGLLGGYFFLLGLAVLWPLYFVQRWIFLSTVAHSIHIVPILPGSITTEWRRTHSSSPIYR